MRWLAEPKKLSQDQRRILEECVRQRETVCISAASLIEIALLMSDDVSRIQGKLEDVLAALESNVSLRVLPITYEIAADFGSLAVLRDPSDRTIVATARVHGLRLLTSDQRIIESELVRVV